MSARADRVAVVIGSSRPSRICPGIAEWTRGVLAQAGRLDYELLDLAEIDLPMLDEPLMAALDDYAHDHTRRWSTIVAEFAGFVFVAPQYNWGYPAVLKNALDFLYVEWEGKPATTVTYGTRGGEKAAAQLAVVLQGLHMHPLPDRLEVKITAADVDEAWQLRDLEAVMDPYREELRTIDAQLAAALGVG